MFTAVLLLDESCRICRNRLKIFKVIIYARLAEVSRQRCAGMKFAKFRERRNQIFGGDVIPNK